MFVSKYAPLTLSEFVGNKEAVATARRWLGYWPKIGKVLLLLGPAGLGKTTLATLLAKEVGYEFFEVNASDTRNKDTIIHQVAPATLEQGLFGSRRLVLIDEVDGMAGNEDRGGLQSLVDVIQKTKQPLILTGNDIKSDKIYLIEKKCKKDCTKLVLNLPTKEEIKERLKLICEKESISANDGVLSRIVEIARFDIRNSINIIEQVGFGKNSINDNDLNLLKGKDVFLKENDILFRVLKSKKLSIALDAMSANKSNFYPTDLIYCFEENLPYIYKNANDLAEGYLWLAEADKYASRIKKQNWFYLTNVAQCLASISTAKTQPINITPEEKFRHPQIGLMIWRGKQQQAEKDNFCFCKMWAPKLHISWNKMKINYPIYLAMICNNT